MYSLGIQAKKIQEVAVLVPGMSMLAIDIVPEDGTWNRPLYDFSMIKSGDSDVTITRSSRSYTQDFCGRMKSSNNTLPFRTELPESGIALYPWR